MNPPEQAAGLQSRRVAADILAGVLHRKHAFDEQLETVAQAELSERDRALVRMLCATVLRRLGTLRTLLGQAMPRGLPPHAPRVEIALLLGAAQILLLEVPDHAAVDLSVRLAQDDRQAHRYAGLVNAVLRRIARDGRTTLQSLDPIALDTPAWLRERWTKIYGERRAREILAAHALEPALDIAVKGDAEQWAKELGGHVVFGRTVRCVARGPVSKLAGYEDGAWWVQDAAASLPVYLLGNVAGLRVADLCAAPGGKAVQLAAAGAQVTAVDRSANRLRRLAENLSRLRLHAEIVVADASEWRAGPFDAVLLDPPCTATGTIRRHPDVPWLKHESDLVGLAAVQTRLLEHAAELVKPGGLLVYCTCSLEPEEGEEQIAAFLARHPRWRRRPLCSDDVLGRDEFIDANGDLRTLPCYLPNSDSRLAGLDGFYAARLQLAES